MNFIEATHEHLDQIKHDMSRIQGQGAQFHASTSDSIARDVLSHSAAGRGGVGCATMAGGKRPREDNELVSSLTLRMLLFCNGCATGPLVSALTVSARPQAVAFIVPQKWSLLHLVVLPKPTSMTRSDTFPRSWKELSSRLSVSDWLTCLNDVREVQREAAEKFCDAAFLSQILSGSNEATRSLTSQEIVGRWSSNELEVARHIYCKRRGDNTLIMPIKIGLFSLPVSDLFDCPAIHLISADGCYAHRAAMWNAVFSKAHFIDVPLVSGTDVLSGVLCETHVEAMSGSQLIALRKSLNNCVNVKCPLCTKLFESVELAAKHWVQKCLPHVAAAMKIGEPLIL